MNLDADLDTLETQVRQICDHEARHPIDVWRDEVGSRVSLCVSTNEFGDDRLLRIRASLGYGMYWSCFHDPIDHDEDGDGDRRGDLDFILRAVRSFLIEGRRWQELPELGG